jgi:hypothetical protein
MMSPVSGLAREAAAPLVRWLREHVGVTQRGTAALG